MYIEGTVRACVGCGYCCRKAPCVAAARVYGNGLKSCPALSWDGSRYWCKLCQVKGKVGADYGRELSVGEGCCCGVNSDRQHIPPPAADVVPQVPQELVAVLRALGGEFMSSDALYLAMRRAEGILKRPGFAAYCLTIITENRAKSTGEFMG
jgi:hypothetical protein